MVKKFVDISHHNPDPINWQVYAADSDRDRICLKATEHLTFTDNKFVERCRAAHDHNLDVMAYHFIRCGLNPIDQFKHFLAVLRQSDFDLWSDTVVLDYEDIDTTGYLKKARPNAIEFVKAAVEAGFENGLIYSYRLYLNNTGLIANDLPPGWRKLWIATYTQGLPDNQVGVPNGWNRDQILARQYTDKAHVAGITGEVDDNRVIRDWLNTQPPVGDWWDTVDDATAQAMMEKAVKKVFNLQGNVAFPNGRVNNDNFIVDLTTMARVGFNTDRQVQDLIDWVKTNSTITGPNETELLAKLDAIKAVVNQT